MADDKCPVCWRRPRTDEERLHLRECHGCVRDAPIRAESCAANGWHCSNDRLGLVARDQRLAELEDRDVYRIGVVLTPERLAQIERSHAPSKLGHPKVNGAGIERSLVAAEFALFALLPTDGTWIRLHMPLRRPRPTYPWATMLIARRLANRGLVEIRGDESWCWNRDAECRRKPC